MDKFYDKDGIIVRRSVVADIDKMKNKLREADVKEIWASHHRTPEEALKICVEDTMFSLTVQNGVPICMFGFNATEVLGQRATVWMLATNDLEKIQKRFLRNCRRFVEIMLEFYPYLENWVHTDNKKSIQWLKFLGATVEKAQPYGVEGELFHHFYFLRKDI